MNINRYITFTTSNTRASSSNKLHHQFRWTTIARHFYFSRLWNALPNHLIDLSLWSIYNYQSVCSKLYGHSLTPLLYPNSNVVPITYMSPPIVWCNTALSPTAVVRSSLLILNCCFLANIDAIKVKEHYGNLDCTSAKLYEHRLKYALAPRA